MPGHLSHLLLIAHLRVFNETSIAPRDFGQVDESPEERLERLRALAKEKVRELTSQPQRFGVNTGVGADPATYTGPRGGRYTRAQTKDGRPYRRYF